jgi:hypothetical protein
MEAHYGLYRASVASRVTFTFTLLLKQHQNDSTQCDVRVLIPTINDIVEVDAPPVDADSGHGKAYKKQTVISPALFRNLQHLQDVS